MTATQKVLAGLERRGLIQTFKPTARSLRVREGNCVVEKIYSTSPRFGTHKLICVGKNETNVALTTHPDNEDFFIINPVGCKFKPLYLIIGLGGQGAIEKKARLGQLREHDFLAICLKYNDPKVCAFTMLKNTPHCEVTLPGPGRAPVFFVTEPSRFKMDLVNLGCYQLGLDKRL
ncbi:MAG: hypothetical protein WCY36_06415 [Candidatus Omnitrophota bacterium]